jgi:hypothetical protein
MESEQSYPQLVAGFAIGIAILVGVIIASMLL